MKVLIGEVKSYSSARSFIEKVFSTFDFEAKYLKPNFLKYDNPENGCITHPELLKAILFVAREFGYDLKVIEGGFFRNSAKRCFEEFGLNQIAECINLNDDEFVDAEINGRELERVKVSKISLEAREKGFITVPKMKVHHLTKVTLGIKNNMGFLKKPAIYMHPNIHAKLVDLAEFFQPSLTIIDGVIGGTNSEMNTKAIHHGVLISSDNVVAADLVASKLMGFTVAEVEHLRLAMERFGVVEKDIEVVCNSDIEKLVRRDYRLSLGSRILSKFGI